MNESHHPLLAIFCSVILSVIVLPPGAVEAQPVGCDFCGNHFWYNEHIHGDEAHSLYDNEQGHGGAWYPYNCGVDHRLCEESKLALNDGATAVMELMDASDAPDHDFHRVLERLALRGVEARLSQTGLRLSVDCEMTDADPRTRTVVLSAPVRERFREALGSSVQG